MLIPRYQIFYYKIIQIQKSIVYNKYTQIIQINITNTNKYILSPPKVEYNMLVMCKAMKNKIV